MGPNEQISLVCRRAQRSAVRRTDPITRRSACVPSLMLRHDVVVSKNRHTPRKKKDTRVFAVSEIKSSPLSLAPVVAANAAAVVGGLGMRC